MLVHDAIRTREVLHRSHDGVLVFIPKQCIVLKMLKSAPIQKIKPLGVLEEAVSALHAIVIQFLSSRAADSQSLSLGGNPGHLAKS